MIQGLQADRKSTSGIEAAQAVLVSLVQKEIEVRTGEDRQYTMRILPYRTLNNVVEGAVITFVDHREGTVTNDTNPRRNLSDGAP